MLDLRTPGPSLFSKCVIILFSECSIREKKESQRKVWEFDRLSEETPWVQLDEVREKSGKMKLKKVATL